MILVSDGHMSRGTPAVIEYLKAFNIELVILPAHMSHVFQPIDLAITHPLKAAMARDFDRFEEKASTIEFASAAGKKRYVYVGAYLNAHSQLGIENAKSGFKKAGIYSV